MTAVELERLALERRAPRYTVRARRNPTVGRRWQLTMSRGARRWARRHAATATRHAGPAAVTWHVP